MTSTPLVIRRAGQNEFSLVMGLLEQRIDWLRDRGSDQWSTWEAWPEKIKGAIGDGVVWLLVDGGQAVGTITLEFHGDPEFWTADELAEPAVYLSKLAVRLDHAGQELGVLLMDWASDYAYCSNRLVARLDAWKANNSLHHYYSTRGWKYLRTAHKAGRNSGALFEMTSRPMPREQQVRVKYDDSWSIQDTATEIGPDNNATRGESS